MTSSGPRGLAASTWTSGCSATPSPTARSCSPTPSPRCRCTTQAAAGRRADHRVVAALVQLYLLRLEYPKAWRRMDCAFINHNLTTIREPVTWAGAKALLDVGL
eukprot:3733238-Prymnesium_polylepis.1